MGLFVRLKKSKTAAERSRLDTQCSALYHANKARWKLYLRATGFSRSVNVVRRVDNSVSERYCMSCVSCGRTTYWDCMSGVRRGVDDRRSHHFCKKLIDFSSDSFVKAPQWLKNAFCTRVCNENVR